MNFLLIIILTWNIDGSDNIANYRNDQKTITIQSKQKLFPKEVNINRRNILFWVITITYIVFSVSIFVHLYFTYRFAFKSLRENIKLILIFSFLHIGIYFLSFSYIKIMKVFAQSCRKKRYIFQDMNPLVCIPWLDRRWDKFGKWKYIVLTIMVFLFVPLFFIVIGIVAFVFFSILF